MMMAGAKDDKILVEPTFQKCIFNLFLTILVGTIHEYPLDGFMSTSTKLIIKHLQPNI